MILMELNREVSKTFLLVFTKTLIYVLLLETKTLYFNSAEHHLVLIQKSRQLMLPKACTKLYLKLRKQFCWRQGLDGVCVGSRLEN